MKNHEVLGILLAEKYMRQKVFKNKPDTLIEKLKEMDTVIEYIKKLEKLVLNNKKQ